MQKTDNMPLWVYLAFSSIGTRKGALLLIGSCAVFSIYCVPWSQIFTSYNWVKEIFIIKDWSWFATMIPITFWYLFSLKWIDNNSSWSGNVEEKE